MKMICLCKKMGQFFSSISRVIPTWSSSSEQRLVCLDPGDNPHQQQAADPEQHQDQAGIISTILLPLQHPAQRRPLLHLPPAGRLLSAAAAVSLR